MLDVAIFCLSLMGANFTDYVRVARRCLHLDGWLHIWEPTRTRSTAHVHGQFEVSGAT